MTQNIDNELKLQEMTSFGLTQFEYIAKNEITDNLQQETYVETSESLQTKVKKQNKDEANASRTARIAIYDLIQEQYGKRELSRLFQNINLNYDQMKNLVRSMGEKEFVRKILLRKQLRAYFSEAFELLNQTTVQKVLRVNKKSQVSYEERLELVLRCIEKFRQTFITAFPKQQIKEETPSVVIVLQPIPLPPFAYQQYMYSKGIKI